MVLVTEVVFERRSGLFEMKIYAKVILDLGKATSSKIYVGTGDMR